MNRKLKDIDTSIRQWFADWCEMRSLKAKNIKREIFWDKLGVWILNL